jgi:tetratricopeptide (TPR) repeat protein
MVRADEGGRCRVPSGTRATLLFAAAAAGVLHAQDDPYAADVAAIDEYLSSGKLTRAEALIDELLLDFEDAAAAEMPDPRVQVGLRRVRIRLALMRGEYERARELLTDALPGWRGARGIRLLAAELFRETGRYEQAIAEYDAMLADDAEDLRARVELGILQDEVGAHGEARKRFEEVVAAGDRRAVRDAEGLFAIAAARIRLGGKENIERASVLLLEALRVDPDAWRARLELARLRYMVYREAAGFPNGEEELQKILERHGDVEEALVELYRQRRGNHLLDGSKTDEFLQRALLRNPNSVPALTERGRMLIDDRRFEAGAEVLDGALRINPRSKRALAHRAAAARLLGEDELDGKLRERIAGVDAEDPIADLVLGDHLVRLYRFEDALRPYRAVLERDPDHLEALEGLGRALVYSAQGEEAERVLQRAKSLQPGFVNPWRRNQLALQQLLFEEYKEIELDGFDFLIHRDDVDVLSAYLVPFQQEAREILGRKYGWFPERQVRVEVYHTWDDFSVRTIGYRGFTALGACFGPLITLVSPSDGDLRRNDFPWAATVWHEYTHVLTLGLSDARIPRWLTEGFSVYEEKTKNPAWERGMTRELLDAWANAELPPVRELNGLFRDPSQILFGYFLGGEIVGMLAEEHGFAKVAKMLTLYGDDLTTEQVLEQGLGVRAVEVDRQFRLRVEREVEPLRIEPRWSIAAIERMLQRIARDPKNVQARTHLAWAYAQRGNPIDASGQLRQIALVAPDHAPAFLVRALLAAQRGETDEAIALWRQGFAGGADDFDARIAYGDALRKRGELDEAITQYQAAQRCWPGCTDQGSSPTLRLAAVYRESGRKAEAIEQLEEFVARTGRAFKPRLELASYARNEGDRARELKLLEEANDIDPFCRSLHLRLADAYEALGRRNEAVRELRVSLAVLPSLDRDYLDDPQGAPSLTDPDVRRDRAAVMVRIGRLLRELGSEEQAREALEDAVREAPGTAPATEAERLLGR